MNITSLSTTDSKVQFVIEDVDVGFVNALRRILISEIPLYAVDHIAVYENTSILYDEVLTHRIGLVPLRTPPGVTKEVTLSIEKEGPGIVYSKDMVSEDDLIRPTIGEIPIAKLGENQKISVNCIATMGTAQKHAKYQSSLAFYKAFPIITIDEKCDLCEACIEACPKEILVRSDDTVEIENIEECTLCKACEEVCDLAAITVDHDPRKFIFTIENYGNMSTKDLIRIATKIIEKKCEDFMDALAGVAEPGQRR